MTKAEIIFEKHIDLGRFSRNTIPKDSKLHNVIINAMQEYADQEKEAYLKQKVSEITDEEIDNKFPTDGKNIKMAYSYSDNVEKRCGAKWFKEKLLNSK